MPIQHVIFIGGTSYSGSTFFDMMLANDSGGFSCGEINAMFYPNQEHHFQPRCGCGRETCTIWKHIRLQGKNLICESIASISPDTAFIVDSSKHPFWIREQCERLKKKKVRATNVLIWKSPYEFAFSYQKKKRPGWDRDWINYYLTYFSLVKDWKALAYKDLVQHKSKFRDVCKFAGIDYFEGKEKFWDKTHHTLFGNRAAKIHLYAENDANYDRIAQNYNIEKNQGNRTLRSQHKTIYYLPVQDERLRSEVEYVIRNNPIIKTIQNTLMENDVSSKTTTMSVVEAPGINPVSLALKRAKYEINKRIAQTKLRRLIEKTGR